MIDYQRFMQDAARATARQGLDTEPVCYIGDQAYTELLASVVPGCDFMLHGKHRHVGGVQVYRVSDDVTHYHMTFRKKVQR